MTGESVDMIAHRSATPTLESHNSLDGSYICLPWLADRDHLLRDVDVLASDLSM